MTEKKRIQELGEFVFEKPEEETELMIVGSLEIFKPGDPLTISILIPFETGDSESKALLKVTVLSAQLAKPKEGVPPYVSILRGTSRKLGELSDLLSTLLCKKTWHIQGQIDTGAGKKVTIVAMFIPGLVRAYTLM
jgi:hypothetical protein